jgi:2,4-dienoyl-CoA reductase-like NADH-dependent reductase (Old Yellow Enzyme family)
MSTMKITSIASLKSSAELRAHIESLGIDLQLDDAIQQGPESPLAEKWSFNGRTIGNRWAVHPMEGWDGTVTGGITEPMIRRWQRFGESGAKFIWGGEAMAVCPEGRANPNQIIINQENKAGIARLRDELAGRHQAVYGTADDLFIGFQLTHSGRFCRPNDKKTWESRVAYRHPILDPKFNVTSDHQVLTDDDVRRLIDRYIEAAKIARDAGADFVDIKHCHGYLLHEFLSAHTRPGDFGGSFENRTRPLREIVVGIRAAVPGLEIGVRLSAFCNREAAFSLTLIT